MRSQGATLDVRQGGSYAAELTMAFGVLGVTCQGNDLNVSKFVASVYQSGS